MPVDPPSSTDPDLVTPADPGAAVGDGKVILVIDDEPVIRMLIVDLLGDAGYAVREVGDAEQGLHILQAPGSIDLLITDVGLPGGMNGREVAQAARRSRPDLKVLFITGYHAPGSAAAVDRWTHIITKPFTMAALLQAVRQMLALPT